MEMQFLTLLADNNDWIDWISGRYVDSEGIDEPKEFPCYVADECIGWADKDKEGDYKGDALFAPHFLYLEDLEDMLEAM